MNKKPEHRKNLVVLPFGNSSLNSDWITNDMHREFDVVLLAYHRLHNSSLANNPAVEVFEYLDYKWWMVQDFFTQHPHYLTRYNAFFFPDDDIEITRSQINQLFRYFNGLPIMLSQPSLTADSFASWPVLFSKKWSAMRYVTTVELMCPIMKRATLEHLLPTFKLTQSGWGIDLLWGKMIAEKFGPLKITVLDLIEVRHGKPVGEGELYTKINQPARSEENGIREKYDLLAFQIQKVKCFANTIWGRGLQYLRLLPLKSKR